MVIVLLILNNLTGMDPFMFFQVALLRKSLVAIAARERFLAVVRVDVNVQRTLLYVVLFTVGIWTGEQLLLRMMFHVLGKGSGPLETFAAHRTQIRFANHIAQLSGMLSMVFR